MLALELKDMAKLPDVLVVITKVGLILSLFWGRKRWARMKLKEPVGPCFLASRAVLPLPLLVECPVREARGASYEGVSRARAHNHACIDSSLGHEPG